MTIVAVTQVLLAIVARPLCFVVTPDYSESDSLTSMLNVAVATMLILAAVSQKLIPQHLQKIKIVVQHK